jgi:hypothetical protein
VALATDISIFTFGLLYCGLISNISTLWLDTRKFKSTLFLICTGGRLLSTNLDIIDSTLFISNSDIAILFSNFPQIFDRHITPKSASPLLLAMGIHDRENCSVILSIVNLQHKNQQSAKVKT